MGKDELQTRGVPFKASDGRLEQIGAPQIRFCFPKAAKGIGKAFIVGVAQREVDSNEKRRHEQGEVENNS